MNKNYLKIVALSMLTFALITSGCDNQKARRIDSSGTETITTVSGLNIQDATDAADALSQSLLESGTLGKNGKPSIIAIDRYINSTSQQIDRDRLIKKIRVILNKAGVAQTITTLDAAGNVGGESTIASKVARERQQEKRADAFLEGKEAPKSIQPDFTLTFKILEDKVRAGKIRQTTYIFQMSITDIKTGVAVWEDEKRITKQGRKPSVGW